ncbi:MAG: glycine zipper domain-containing protein [Verrucomicrobiales bacterium]
MIRAIAKPGVALTLAASLLLSGCETMSDGDVTRAQGAGLGAVLGGAAGGLITGDWQGALIGAGVGAMAGGAYGNHVAAKKAQYANTEAYLNACISSAQHVNNDAYAYNNSLNNQIASLEAEVHAAIAANDKARLRAKKSEITKLQQGVKAQMDIVNREKQIQRDVYKNEKAAGAPAATLSSLSSEIGTLETRNSSLQSNYNRLASLNNQIDI